MSTEPSEVESRQPVHDAETEQRDRAGKGARSRRRPVVVEGTSINTDGDASTTVAVAEPDEYTVGCIEAVLLSVDRPVSAVGLAEALGLLTDSGTDPVSGEPGAEPAIVTRARGKSKGGSGTSSPMQVVRRAVESLNQQYEQTGRAFRIAAVAGGYRVMTLPRFAGIIQQFAGKRERTSLSRAAVETLAIVAYKQPMTRAQLEAIRGVACGEVLRTLMERRLITITGRAEELGRPMLYGTTRQFLEAFGLSALKDLPSAAEFKARHVGGNEVE